MCQWLVIHSEEMTGKYHSKLLQEVLDGQKDSNFSCIKGYESKLMLGFFECWKIL